MTLTQKSSIAALLLLNISIIKKMSEKSICAYCGDAPVNHRLAYFGSVISLFFDTMFNWAFRLVPAFAVRVVDKLLQTILRGLVFLRIIKLSDNIELATTLRSRVIWDEAIRRGIKMEQLVIFGRHTDNYRAKVNDKYIYFNSLPVPSEAALSKENWDDKFFLKKKFSLKGLPVPRHAQVPFSLSERKSFFEKFEKPLIVKPRLGSRGRHTITNIHTLEEFESAVKKAREISVQVVAEEYLEGYVCRATCVAGKLVGFYRAESASVVGDGEKTISELIEEKNAKRHERISPIQISDEMKDFVARCGYHLESVLPKGVKVNLSHRIGRFFGGSTKEMLPELHPSFVPMLEKAGIATGLNVAGFDCIIPDPELVATKQRWGIIECNTLPFIDLHYFALEGKPPNIAGMIWDFWKK